MTEITNATVTVPRNPWMTFNKKIIGLLGAESRVMDGSILAQRISPLREIKSAFELRL